MKQEKYEQKIKKKYGVTKEELKDLSISKIKNLKVKDIDEIIDRFIEYYNNERLQEKIKIFILRQLLKVLL